MRKNKSVIQQISKLLKSAPIVRKLSGTLSQNVSLADYKEHLEQKYGVKK